MKGYLRISCLMLLLIPSVTWAADSEGLIVSAASLKEDAAFSSKTLRELPIGILVKVGGRYGGWQHITVDEKHSGWVRAYQVRTDIESSQVPVVKKKQSGGFLSGLSNFSRKTSSLFGKKESTSNDGDLVATIGVRGLSEQDLKKAKPNAEEFKKLASYAVNENDAKKYAKTAGLKAADVDHLPEPKKKK